MCVCGWGDLPLSGSIYNVLTLAVSTITSVKVILRSPAHVNPLLRCLCGKVQIHCCGMDDKPVSVWLASYSKSQPGLENYILTIDLCNKTKSNDMYGHNDPCWQDGKWSVFYELLQLTGSEEANKLVLISWCYGGSLVDLCCQERLFVLQQGQGLCRSEFGIELVYCLFITHDGCPMAWIVELQPCERLWIRNVTTFFIKHSVYGWTCS